MRKRCVPVSPTHFAGGLLQVADLEQPVTVDLHVLLYGIMHSLDPW